MRPPVDPFHKAYRLEIGKVIRATRLEKDLKPSFLMKELNLKPAAFFNIEVGKAGEKNIQKMIDYLGIDHQKVARDLRNQMQIKSTSMMLDGDEVQAEFIIGKKVYDIKGRVIPSLNVYKDVKIISLTDDDGLSNDHPDINRIAVHKSKIKSLC